MGFFLIPPINCLRCHCSCHETDREVLLDNDIKVAKIMFDCKQKHQPLNWI